MLRVAQWAMSSGISPKVPVCKSYYVGILKDQLFGLYSALSAEIVTKRSAEKV